MWIVTNGWMGNGAAAVLSDAATEEEARSEALRLFREDAENDGPWAKIDGKPDPRKWENLSVEKVDLPYLTELG